jgi:ubiquinone/menaquinone biosynthesis C-methylase UbiE
MLKQVDYDERQHEVYAKGRAIPAETVALWVEAFAAHAPATRPLAVLDLGCGIGRFTPALADTFGGPVYGVEPSRGMRVQAEASAAHPQVRYLEGRAEAIPLPDASCDLVLMFLSFHHFRDQPTAAREIARVLRPGGRILMRSAFSERCQGRVWHRFFPEALEVERRVFPTVAQVEALFAPLGLKRLALEGIEVRYADSLADYAERLSHRAISIFELMHEADVERGFAALNGAVAAEREPRPVTDQDDLLVLG